MRLPGVMAVVLEERDMRSIQRRARSGRRVGYNAMGKHPFGAALVREGHWQGSMDRGLVGSMQRRR